MVEEHDIQKCIEEYMVKWAERLSEKSGRAVAAEPFDISCVLLNDAKCRNYLTACALIFGLSFVAHGPYLSAAAKALEAAHKEGGYFDVTTEWLAEYVQYYIKEVAEYPTGA